MNYCDTCQETTLALQTEKDKTMSTNFHVKHQTIESIYWTGKNYDNVRAFLSQTTHCLDRKSNVITIPHASGLLTAVPERWITKLPDGKVFVNTDRFFKAMFESNDKPLYRQFDGLDWWAITTWIREQLRKDNRGANYSEVYVYDTARTESQLRVEFLRKHIHGSTKTTINVSVDEPTASRDDVIRLIIDRYKATYEGKDGAK